MLATQYRKGGSGEWGGRYFAIGLPLIVPVAVVALHRTARGLDRELRRIVVGAFVALSAVLCITAMITLRHYHELTDRVITNLVTTAAGTDPGDGGPPVVVSTLAAVPRLGWREVPDGRWFLVLTKADLESVFTELGRVGIDEVTLATNTGYGIPALDGWTVERTSETTEGIPAVVYQRNDA